jgi:hypothetical protein
VLILAMVGASIGAVAEIVKLVASKNRPQS